MKIESAEVFMRSIPLKRPYTIAFETVSTVDLLYTVITLENGVKGYGSGSASEHVTGEVLSKSFDFLQSALGDIVVGRKMEVLPSLSAHVYASLWDRPAACAAVDMAIYDAYCKMHDISLLQYWGRKQENLPTSITIGIKDTVEESLHEAKEYLDAGFRHIKLKIGNNPQQDAQTCRELLSLLGKDAYLRVDGNQGYDATDIRNFLDLTKSLPIELVEQPMSTENIGAMRFQSEEIRMKCAADENLHSPLHAIELLQEPRPFGIFNIKLMKCGGPTAAKRIADIAALGNVKLMWGCNDESPISISAALQTALSCPNTQFLDLDGSFDLAETIVDGGYMVEDGFLKVYEERAGLGVVPNEKFQN